MQKSREERRKVLVRARMRCGAAWSDACIVNIASRGLGMQSGSPPERGEYVEIRRGRHLIVGQVVWSNGHRFGVRARGTLPIFSIINEPDRLATPPAEERRTALRAPQTEHEQSRQRASAAEFMFAAFTGICFMILIATMVQEAFARPLAVISTTLSEE